MRRAALLGALLSMAFAPAAAASTVSVEDATLVVTGAPGETNEVFVSERFTPGSSRPSEYAVKDTGAGTTAGAGCAPDPTLPPQGSPVVCGALPVDAIVVRLGDGDDGAGHDTTAVPISIYGEGGNDRIAMLATARGIGDGGVGNDELQGGSDVRGGSGDDRVTGSALLYGGAGDDVLRKTGATAGGRLSAGAGDDSLRSDDGWADELSCADGRDVVVAADESDKSDGTCESGKGVGGGGPVKAQVTVFELPKGRSRPGRDGRLGVLMRCSVPACVVTVKIFAVGDVGTKSFARFRKAPARRVVVGKKTKLIRLRLTREQRRGLSRSESYSGVGAVVITHRPGADARMLTDGLYCRRADPCRDSRAPR